MSYYAFMPRGGTDPRKVWVGLDQAGIFKLYLYKCEKIGVYSIFFNEKGGSILYYFRANNNSDKFIRAAFHKNLFQKKRTFISDFFHGPLGERGPKIHMVDYVMEVLHILNFFR